MRRAVTLMVLAVLSAGCATSNLGRSVPACPVDPDVVNTVTATMILQMQAVDTAEYIPCLNDLKVGWSYNDLVAHRGKSSFSLDSDRLGSRFLEVTLTPACDVGAAPALAGPRDDVVEFRSVTLVGATVTVVIIPVTGRETEHAELIEDELEARSINSRQVFAVFDDDDEPLADKVAAAAGRGRPVVIVDEQDALAGTATLSMPGDARAERGLDLEDLLDRLAARLPGPSFTGTWHQVFPGGCVTYEFDASGPGVDRLAADVEEALGLFPAGEVRRAMRAEGVLG